MTLAPLIAAGWIVVFHTICALAAFVLGVWQFAAPKGTPRHKAVGRLWVLAMLCTALSSFLIHDIRQWGPFSWIHLLSIYVLFGLWGGVREARSGNIAEHRKTMTLVFIGAILVAGAFAFAPGRSMHLVIFGN